MDLTDQKVMSKINYKRALVFIVTRSLKNYTYKGKIIGFHGYRNFASFTVEEAQKLYVKLDITKGEAAIVAIQKKQMIVITQGNIDGNVVLPFKKGRIRLRLIGEHSDLTFIIKRL
ncbi:MAG: hypothetical protein WCQ80_01550 [Bacilli bacterium]